MFNFNFITTKAGVDFATANRDFAAHVADFMSNKVWKAEADLKFKTEESKLNKLLDVNFGLEGTILEDEIPTRKAEAEKRLAELEKERETFMVGHTFTMTDEDKALKRALSSDKATGASIKSALITWFKSYGLDVEKAYILTACCEAVSPRLNMKTLVRSKGVKALTIDSGNAWKNVWTICYMYAVKAGTIHATDIPELLSAKYEETKKVIKNTRTIAKGKNTSKNISKKKSSKKVA